MRREYTSAQDSSLQGRCSPACRRRPQSGARCLPSWLQLKIAQSLPLNQAELLSDIPISLSVLYKATRDHRLPLQLPQRGLHRAPPHGDDWTCTGLYAAHYISYMGGNSFRTTTNYLVNPKITADPRLPTTAPLSSIPWCQARVIHHQTSDLLLCCVSPPPCSCPQSQIKSVWDFLNYPLPANRCGKRMP